MRRTSSKKGEGSNPSSREPSKGRVFPFRWDWGFLETLKLPRIPVSLISLVVIGGTIFLLGGGLFNAVSDPIPSTPGPDFAIGDPRTGGRTLIFYYPDQIGTQLIGEGFVFMIFLALGVVGGYLAHRSVRHVYNPRTGNALLGVGIILLLLAAIGINALLIVKVPGFYS